MSSMKSVILSLIVAVALIVPARVITCPDKPGMCKAGECCVEYRGGARRCGPLQKRGGMCSPRSAKPSDVVYRQRCPCREGLTCGAMDFRCVDEE